MATGWLGRASAAPPRRMVSGRSGRYDVSTACQPRFLGEGERGRWVRALPSRACRRLDVISLGGGPRRASRSRPLSVPVAASSKNAEGAASGWWNVGSRFGAELERFQRQDDRSEFGYLEHDSDPVTLFEERSEYNGTVRVVGHGPWRSLRFNDVEQGLTYVFQDGEGLESEGRKDGDADVDVLGYEYLRCMTAAAAAMCRLDGQLCLLRPRPGGGGGGARGQGQRVICVGLGSGAMPAFIAKRFPCTVVEVVEIDPVVIRAVRNHHGLNVPIRNAAMGVSPDWTGSAGDGPGVGVVVGDAGEFMSRAAAAVAAGDAPPAAVVMLDAFDGDGNVPPHLMSPAFLDDCAAVIAPGGVVVANLFNGVMGSDVRANVAAFAVLLDAKIGPVTSWSVETPVNVVLAARKRLGDEAENEEIRFTRAELKKTGSTISKEADIEWDAGTRVGRGFWVSTNDGSSFRETPAGLTLNPLSAFVERMGTVMPDEWTEDSDREQ